MDIDSKRSDILSEDDLKNMENILRSYFRRLEELQVKRIALENVKKNADEARRILLDVNEIVPTKGTIARYKAISGGCGYVNDGLAQNYYEFTSSVERLQKELISLLHRNIKLKMQIIYLESAIEGITFALSLLEPVDRTICEQYYGIRNKSNLQIGLNLNMDEKTIRYRRKRINQKLLQYLKVNP